MTRTFCLLIIALLTATAISGGQTDAVFSHYFMALGYYNPAFAGSTDDMNVVVAHKQQWMGMPGAPKPLYAAVDRPFEAGGISLGVGAALYQESIGLFNNSYLGAQLSFKRKLFGGTISIGLQPGFLSTSFDGSKVDLGESPETEDTDEAIPQAEVNGATFDLNAGIYYKGRNFYVGLASMHLLAPEFELDQNITTFIPRTYNLTGGYNIMLNDTLFELQPSFFVRTDLQTFQGEITGRLVYNKMFSGGLSWRVNESLIVFLGGAFANVEAGYAYDYPISPIRKVSSGSHEVVLRYRFKLDKTKTGNFRHKSVRIL
ncbi:MAG: type IX secretion system membrane protein PorP/SprF [Tannerellaceae bacterium]|jgi:type IX secretion system PorP/SprF family membrane protein|nr:type IX secretion system membrane protein PorP/SprF [Tannerellaceae bacterium]